MEVESYFSQLQRSQQEMKDVLMAWQVRVGEQLRAHRLALEQIVLEQTSEQSRTLQQVAERLDTVLQQRSLVRDGIESEMVLADRLEVSVLGLHLRHEQRLKELEEGHNRWLAERREQLLGAVGPARAQTPRVRGTISSPTLLQTPRSRSKASVFASNTKDPEVVPSSPSAHSASDESDEAPPTARSARSARRVSFEEASQLPSRHSTCNASEMEIERRDLRVSFQAGPPSVCSAASPSDGHLVAACHGSSCELMKPQVSFRRSRSWPSNFPPSLRAGGTTTDSEDTLKFGSLGLGNSALITRQRTAVNVIAELDHLASAHPEGSCWHRFLSSIAHSLRWWNGLREPERQGPLAKVVRSRAFSFLSIIFILFDAVLAAYSSNYLIEHLTVNRTTTMIVLEMCVLAFYCVELLLKLMLHRAYFFLSEDWRWNITDMLVVCNSAMVLSGLTSDVDLSFVRACRVFRIVKIFLLFRMVGFVKQLRLMTECVLNCFLNLFWCIVLVVFISYIFALILVQHLTQYLIHDNTLTEADKDALLANFGSVQLTLLTLFKVATGGDDWDRFYAIIVPTGGLGPPLFLFFVAFFTIAVWNIITSLFIEVAMSRVRPTTRELMVEKHHQDVADVKELTELFLTIDTDESNYISREEFLRFTENAEAMEALQVRGLDIKDRGTFFQMLTSMDSTDHRVGLEEFVDGCLKMRGPASSFDLHVLKFESMVTRRSIMRALRAILGRLEGIERVLTCTSMKSAN